jgi:acetylornithine deacetylase
MSPSAAVLGRLEKLIAFRTVSRDSNLGLIEWVRDELATQGVKSRLTYDNERRKANLFATIGASRADGGLVLSGHTDVVPVDGQDWKTDPFEATVADGKIYGRGATDMKGFIAVVLASVPEMLRRQSDEPLYIALSFDEEVGCLGVPRLLEDIRQAGVRPRGCVVGEPTNMEVVIGHKGASVHRCTVLGRPAHSSLAPEGVNAISYAASLIDRLRQIAVRLYETETAHSGYDIAHTTVNVGVINGGVASNIVAERCEFRFDIRYLPWTAPRSIVDELYAFAQKELLPEMRAIAPEASISFECVGQVPALATEAGAPLVSCVSRLLAATQAPTQVGFGTEAGLFDAAGIPALICGPGSIAQAHKPDEFVTLEQLARCEQFIQTLIRSTELGKTACQ